MKAIAINSSARANGNTNLLILEMFKELKKAGIETEIISLAGKSINPCKACFTCGGKGTCTFANKDSFGEIFDKMKSADAIILASPTYSANISASMQALLERSAVVGDMNAGLFTRKIGASIVSARRGGALNAVDAINHFFLNHEMFVVGSTYWNMGYGALPGDVLNDKEALENMKNLGENIAFALKKLNA